MIRRKGGSMRKASWTSIPAIPAFFFFLSIHGLCQDQATIVGIVTDSSGSVIPGTKVTVANTERGFTRDTTANSDGEYTVAKAPIGAYEITASAPGFQKLVRTGITVTVGQTLR